MRTNGIWAKCRNCKRVYLRNAHTIRCPSCKSYWYEQTSKPAELFKAEETPFNLAGELLDNSTNDEGEARVRALAEAEARKAQGTFGAAWVESSTQCTLYGPFFKTQTERTEKQ